MTEKDKNKEYFSHDANAADDPKIMIMMTQLGLEAYGAYWLLIEYLRKQHLYKAPLIILDPLARRYGYTKEKFEVIITKFGLFDSDGEMFWSDSLQRRMMWMNEKSEKARNSIKKRWEKQSGALPEDTNVVRTNNERNTDVIQINKTKQKENKQNKTKQNKKDTPLFSPPVNHNQILIQKWDAWCEFRKKLKKPYKTTEGASAAYNKLLNLAGSDSELAIRIINQSMENEWVGFFPLKTPLQRDGPSAMSSPEAIAKRIRELAKTD